MKAIAILRSPVIIKVLLLTIALSGAFIVYLRDTPIGFLFWSLVYLFISSLFALLFLTSFRYRSSKYLWKRITAYLLGVCYFVILILFVISHFNLNFWSSKLSDLSEQEWKEDFEYLTRQIIERHPSHFSEEKNQEFIRLVEKYNFRLHEMSINEKIVAFNKVIALLDDGHSSIWPGFEPINSHSFPVQFYFFDDGLFIIDTDRSHKEFIGSKVVKIGNKSVDELYNSLKLITGSENKIGKKVRFTMYAVIAEILFSEGAIDTIDELKLTLEREGSKRQSVTFSPISSSLWMYWAMVNPKSKNTSTTFKNLRSNFYFFEYWPESKTVYLQFNIVFDKILFGESIEEFSQRLDAFAVETDFDRFIIDLRNNNGGNNGLLSPLIDVIRKNQKINRSGKLFTIIGRHTFSAALNFAHALENQTKTLFVGESAGAGPNFYGDTPDNKLPNSGIKLILSTLFWQNSIAEDPRNSIKPDILTNYTHRDFLNKTDPCIDAILNYRPVEKQDIPELEPIPELEGVYHFSNTKLLTIRRDSSTSHFSFTVNDFVPRSFSDVYSDLHFITQDSLSTDINNVYLINKNGQLYFNWFGIKKDLAPIPLDNFEAIKYINAGIREGINRGFNFMKPNETDLNNWGHHFAERDNLEVAVNIFIHNSLKHPSSSSFLSLGEAYMAMGDTISAVRKLKKVIKLDSKNIRAKEILNSIGNWQELEQ